MLDGSVEGLLPDLTILPIILSAMARVQIHDSYMFTAKSYHITGYLFKSIDSWLRGICKRY